MKSPVEVLQVRGHYEVWVHGEFYCSCDNLVEVVEEVNAWVCEEHEAQIIEDYENDPTAWAGWAQQDMIDLRRMER